MKKYISIFSLTSLILLASALPTKTLAAKTNDDTKVEFGLIGDKSENKEPVKIPNAVNIGEHSKFNGQVALTNSPKLSFDGQRITNKEISVNSKGKSGEVPGFRVDDISGTGAGWTLRASASEFVRDDGSGITLSGANLIFPKVTSKTLPKNSSSEPKVNKLTVPFDGKTSQVLLDAGKGKGMGAWEVAYDESKIKLQLPSGQLEGQYEATVTYSLTVGDTDLEAAK